MPNRFHTANTWTPTKITLAILASCVVVIAGIRITDFTDEDSRKYKRIIEPQNIEQVRIADYTDKAHRINEGQEESEEAENVPEENVPNENIEEIETRITDSTDKEKTWSPPEVLPESVNLDVPFTSQAPHANWELPYQEACEEASALMAARFIQDRTIDSPEDADAAILQLVDYAESQGIPIDATAEQTVTIINDIYNLNARVEPFDWQAVKESLAQGYSVIVPAAGQELQNPYFTPPGPLYHMLVITGYTPTEVITNDPGTKRGANLAYTYETLENAIHDWNGGNVLSGAKVMIIVQP